MVIAPRKLLDSVKRGRRETTCVHTAHPQTFRLSERFKPIREQTTANSVTVNNRPTPNIAEKINK